ncbi:MAG: hypothetical protein HY606_10510 [Planctomycetes bacterium]|nr:hypothetical protein [Planctomycetota bacterium]
MNLRNTIIVLCINLTASIQAEEISSAQESKDTGVLEFKGNKLSFYGMLRMDLIYADSKLDHNQFPFFAKREDKSLGDKENDEFIDMHPRLTRFGFDLSRDSIPMWEKAKLQGKFEIDWQNRATSETGGTESESRQLPRLRHAFLKVTDSEFTLLAGQTWDLIAPLFPSVNADSLMWNTGNLGDRRPQIRGGYTTALWGATKGQLDLALARTGAVDRKDLDANGARDGDDSGVPMIQMRVGLISLVENMLDLGIWGHQGWEETTNRIAGDDDFNSSSAGLDAKFTPAPEWIIMTEIWSGKNLSDIRGGVGQGINTTTGDEIMSKGGWVDVGYKIYKWYTLSAGFGSDNPDDGDLNTGGRESNKAFWIGNKFDLGGGFITGLEFIRWNTTFKNQDDGDANRFNLYLTYQF